MSGAYLWVGLDQIHLHHLYHLEQQEAVEEEEAGLEELQGEEL